MTAHERLDKALNEERLKRRPRMDWTQVAAEIGISTRTLADIRKGRGRPRGTTAAAIDDYLGWPTGSVTELFTSGDPPTTSVRTADEQDQETTPPAITECPECFALLRPERMTAHVHWHDRHVEQWHRDPRDA